MAIVAASVAVVATIAMWPTRSSGERQVSVPYPGSVTPNEVIENLTVLAQQLRLAHASPNPEIAMTTAQTRIRRLQRVNNELFPNDYLIVELADAAGNLSGTIARYVFFPNVAEPGGSLFTPLVEVDTEAGSLLLNSAGEAFTDRESPVAEEIQTGPPVLADRLRRPLRPLDRW